MIEEFLSEAVGVGAASTTGFERSWSTSFGWEQRLSKAITYDVDLFYRKMDRLIVLDAGHPDLPTEAGANTAALAAQAAAAERRTVVATGGAKGWAKPGL